MRRAFQLSPLTSMQVQSLCSARAPFASAGCQSVTELLDSMTDVDLRVDMCGYTSGTQQIQDSANGVRRWVLG